MIIDRYIVSSILKVAAAALLICTMLVVAVELFSSMNNYVTNNVPVGQILYLSLLGFPEYLMMCASLSFLFATTFFLSQLEGNNEMIMLFNSGLSYRRVCLPILVMSAAASLLFFAFSDSVMIDAAVEHDRLSVELFGQTSTQDSSDITVSAVDGSYVVFASYYSQPQERLYDVTVVERSKDGRVARRLVCDYADYSGSSWIFHEGREYTVSPEGTTAAFFSELNLEHIDLDPYMFTSQARNISTMDRAQASLYLEQLRSADISAWYQAATDYVSRLFAPFSVFILVLISLLMNYRFKRNIFLFSLIQSLCTAVIYYVMQMLVSIMCEQGILHPVFSVIIPAATVLVLSLLIRFAGGVNG